jgi:hypothetical protein
MSTEPTFQQATSIPAQLHEGPLAVAGIDLNVIKVAGQWSATPTGHASAWVTLECGASKVTLAN